MPTLRSFPTPLRAGVGLVARGVETVTHPPAELLLLPLRAVAAAKRTYDGLAEHGEQVLTRWRGGDGAAAPGPPADGAPTPAGDDVTGTVAERAQGPFVPAFTLPDDVEERIAAAPQGAELEREQLPVADFDHLTLGSLRARLARLDAVQLAQLLDWERTHANRAPVVTMLENRLAKVGAGGAP